MVQDLGLKCVSTIRTMAHWDSEKISPDGFNRDGMTSTLSSTHFSVALTKPQIGIGVPALSVSRLFHKLCKKWGHGWHLEQGVYFFLLFCTFTHYWALRQTVGTSAMAPRPFEPYLCRVWKRGLVFQYNANPKAFIILLNPPS